MMELTRKLQWQPTSSFSGDVVRPDGKVLASYYWGADSRQPYLHPVRSQSTNHSLTLNAPFDHSWHKGLWWSWKLINGVVFWEDRLSDHEGEGGSFVVDHSVVDRGDGCFEVNQTLEMRIVNTDELLLTETRRLVFRPHVVGVPGGWIIDWDMTTTAVVDCELGCSPFYPEESWGGYMGMSYRPARCLGWHEFILNSENQTGADACHGQAARWIAYSGAIDELGYGDGENPPLAGMALLSHPENLRHPEPMYATAMQHGDRQFGDMSIFHISPLMREGFNLKAGEQLHLRYRVIPFSGIARHDALDNAWHEYRKGWR
ncbi:MAG: PmoA family protein [Anaerolineae bacterium]|nr:PmoA family protein [Anaerolineae bacterium]